MSYSHDRIGNRFNGFLYSGDIFDPPALVYALIGKLEANKYLTIQIDCEAGHHNDDKTYHTDYLYQPSILHTY